MTNNAIGNFENSDEVRKVNILLVDDNPPNLIALSAILDRADYNLITAKSGREALDLLAREEFAVVLLDVMMPLMDGFEVARQMKKNEATRNIPILFVTAVAKDIKDIYRGYSVGGVDYIQKPLEAEVVCAKVGVFVQLFRQRKEIEKQAEFIRNSERAQFLEREHAARLDAEAAERRFRNLVNALDHAVIWEAPLDLSQFTFISERVEALLGFPREKWVRETGFFMKHVHPDDRSQIQEQLDKLLSGKHLNLGIRFEHRMIAADGSERWFHTGIQDERDAQDIPFRLRGLCVDISPLKRAEQQLREAIHAKDQIVSIVAHDLKTPLAAADMGTRLLNLATEQQDLDQVKQYVTRIKRAIKHTAKLADDILEAEKASTGRITIVAQEENAEEIVNEAVNMLRPLASEKAVHLRLESGASKSVVYCDRERVFQIFSNLIGNAVKFTSEHGEILIRAESSDDGVLFSVHDTGPGIAPDQLSHVFERYWRGDTAQKSGLGLGLTIAKGIVEAHGGKIWADSQEGRGTTFYFTLLSSMAPDRAPSSREA